MGYHTHFSFEYIFIFIYVIMHKWIYSFTWVVLVITFSWEILSVILVRSHFIVNPTKYSSGPVDQVTYYSLVHSIVSINTGLSTISRVSSMCTIIIAVLSLFTIYKRQLSFLRWFNTALRVVVFMYYLNQIFSACMIP